MLTGGSQIELSMRCDSNLDNHMINGGKVLLSSIFLYDIADLFSVSVIFSLHLFYDIRFKSDPSTRRS